MNPSMTTQICCIVGCQAVVCVQDFAGEEGLCADHARLGSPALIERLNTTVRRRRTLERFWSDEELYESVVSSGRYLKLCGATQAAEDCLDGAWARVKLVAILAVSKAGTDRLRADGARAAG